MRADVKFKVSESKIHLPEIVLEDGYTWDTIEYDLEAYHIFRASSSAPVYYSETEKAFYIGYKGHSAILSDKGIKDGCDYLSFSNIPYHVSNKKEMYAFKHMRHIRCEDNGEHEMFLDARRVFHGGYVIKKAIEKKVEEFEKKFIDLDKIVDERQVYYASNGYYWENLERLKKCLFVGMTILCVDDDIGPVAGGEIRYKLTHIGRNDVMLIDEDGSEIRVDYEVLIKKDIENKCRKCDGRHRFDHMYLERRIECIR